MPVLPQIVSQVLKIVDGPNGAPRDLELIIERDAAIAAKLLKVASSSYYGSLPAETLTRAVALLGFSTVKNLVIGIAYQQMIGAKQGSSLLNKVEFWRHSLGVAVGARAIGKVKSLSYTEELYFLGMIHDIGYLVLDRFDPSNLDTLISTSKSNKISIAVAESFTKCVSHSEAGGLLAEKWNLSPFQLASVRFHHTPRLAEESFVQACSIISLADILAHQIGLSNQSPNAEPVEISESLIEAIGLPVAQYEAIKKFMGDEVNKVASSLGIAA